MSRGERNLTEEEWNEMQRRRSQPRAADRGDGGVSADLALMTPKAKRPKMNKTEYAYSLELEARKQAGEILWYGFEKITLKLADDCRYTPDFAVVKIWEAPNDIWVRDLQFIEIKGFLRDDARDKFKIAAEMFPWAEFFMYRKRREKDGGGWELMKHLNGGAG